MLIKRKLYSVMDKEGNLGYYHESNGEEKLFSAVEDERLFGKVKKDNKAAKKATILKKDGGTVSKEEIDAMRNRIEGSKFMQRIRRKKGPVFSESEIRDMVRVKNARQAARDLDESFEIVSARGGKLNFDVLRDNNKRSPESKNLKLTRLRLENFLKEEEKRDAERAAKKAAEEAAAIESAKAKAAAELRKKRVAVAEKLRSKKSFAKNAKIGGGIVLGTTALGAGLYLYNKNKKKEN